jgi:hypothetical protein
MPHNTGEDRKPDGAEEVHDVFEDAPSDTTVPTPPYPFTFPTSSGFPIQQLNAQANQYPTQQLSAHVYLTQEVRSNFATRCSGLPAAGLEGVPIISEDVDLTDLSESELIGYVRQAKNAHSHYFPEGLPPLVETDRAMILFARNVSATVFESQCVPIKARYLSDQNLDLYIRKVAGACHGSVHARVIIDCGFWQIQQGLESSVAIRDATIIDNGTEKLEPDVAVYAVPDGQQAAPRCIIKIEVNHRSLREARELASVYFRSPNVRSVVLLKVWMRRTNGTFAAACIVWVRGEDESIECHAAHDFGMAPIDTRARNNLTGTSEVPPLLIPGVPVDMEYTTPEPRLPITDHSDQVASVSATVVVINATGSHWQLSMANLELNLSSYVKLIERNLE